jgi:copper chaperone
MDSSNTAPSAPGADIVTEQYLVAGMTCSHCVSSVIEELSALDGVRAVTVDLNAGGTSTVTVASSTGLHVASVRAAVDEAGYALVAAGR